MKRVQLTLLFLLSGAFPVWADTAQDYYQMGKDMYVHGNYADSVVILEGVTQNKPDYWEALDVLGRDYASLGNTPKAIAACEKSLELHPDNPSLKDFLVSLKSGTFAVPTPSTGAAATVTGATSGTPIGGATATPPPSAATRTAASKGHPTGGFYIGIGGGADIPAVNWQSAYSVGPGGAFELAYRLDPQFEVGLDVMGFYYSGTNYSGAISDAEIYVLPTFRYHLGGPYLLVSGGAEVELLSGNSGPPAINPELALGAGYEYELAPRTFLFLEGKFNFIFSPLATGNDVPVVAGLRAGL